MDLGTGDGRAVLERARHEPEAFVIGIDASAAGLAESSLRASRPVRKGGLPNALFVVAAAERPPAELLGTAAELTVTFPWGALLRGALALDDAADAAQGIASLLAPGGIARVLVSIDPRDGLELPILDAATAEELTDRWAQHGLDLTDWGPASEDELGASMSSWARRLRAGRDRTAWRWQLRRASGRSDTVEA